MKKLLNDKRFKYGTYSIVITIVVIAILIFINLIVEKFDKSFDLTDESTYSLSEETISVLNDLDNDINIYTMFSTGNSDAVINKVEQVIDKYSQQSSHIKSENMDLYLHPDFAKKYSNEQNTVGVNSIIVEKGERYRVINYNDYYAQSQSETEHINIEANITSAIQYVSETVTSKLYFVTGHDETDHSHFTTLMEQFKLSNYDIDSLNLIDKDIPEDCTALIITPGKRDLSPEEADKIKNYLADDGRGFFLLGGTDFSKFTNLKGVVNAYGVTLENGYILEGNEENYYQYPYAMFPKVTDNQINSVLTEKGYTVYAIASQAVKELDIKKQGLEIQPLLTSTNQSYIKAEGNSSPNVEKNDIKGPFNIAAAITDSSYTDKSHSTKLVVCGTSYYFIDPNYDAMVVNANSTFVVSAINWLNDKGSNVTIAPKTISSEMVLIDEGSANTVKLIGWAVIPGCLFLAGFIIWLIRRNK